MSELSDKTKRDLAEDILLEHIDRVEYWTVKSAVQSRHEDATGRDCTEVYDLIMNADVDITFETKD